MIRILFLCVLAIVISKNSYANPMRKKLDSAWKNEEYNNKLIQYLETCDSKNGYLAVAYIMKSNHATLPWKKLNYFYKGKTLLEKIIALDPSNIEWIYYRYEIQKRIPQMLKYNHINSDLKKMKEYIDKKENMAKDKELYYQILNIIS